MVEDNPSSAYSFSIHGTNDQRQEILAVRQAQFSERRVGGRILSTERVGVAQLCENDSMLLSLHSTHCDPHTATPAAATARICGSHSRLTDSFMRTQYRDRTTQA